MQLKTALTIANRVVELLAPHCDLLHIAGSIRRQKKVVGDIEIVCQPKKETVSIDLFNSEYRTVRTFDLAVDSMAHKISKGNSNGRMMQVILKGGTQLDLFMPQTEDYYRQLTIRTGSSFYVQKVIAAAWRKKGWVGCESLGLRREADCKMIRYGDKDKWVLENKQAIKPPAWQSEEDFFNWLGVEYISPYERETYSDFKFLSK